MFLHWSEGLFLQPHHFQQFQRVINDALNAHSSLAIPYKEGICDIEVDTEALKSKRIVINSLAAVMPDGVFLCMPGNCAVMPHTLDLDIQHADEEITIYLAVPFYSVMDSNLNETGNSEQRRYLLHETTCVDENTGDNETTVFKRSLNVKIITDPKKATDCAVLPIMKLRWTLENSNTPVLEKVSTYTPPTILISGTSNLFTMVRELFFELKNCKSKLLTDIENSGFVPSLATGSNVLKIMQLQCLNVYINTLNNLLVPDKTTPFDLYCVLSNLQASLKALYPLSDTHELSGYDHYNLFGVYDEVIRSIRSLVNIKGKAEFIEIDFENTGSESHLEARFNAEVLSKASEFYIALEGELNWRELLNDIEAGDNFRLIDRGSLESRVRGVKLSYSRFPPRYLPLENSNTVYFKVMKDESARIWRYMLDDKTMIIDCAHSLLDKFTAKLFVLTENEEN